MLADNDDDDDIQVSSIILLFIFNQQIVQQPNGKSDRRSSYEWCTKSLPIKI